MGRRERHPRRPLSPDAPPLDELMASFREQGLVYDAAAIGRRGVVVTDEAEAELQRYGYSQPDADD
jgi:ParB-like chromosome segregation protein Spo0J